MAGPIINEDWADALEPGIREWFFKGVGQRQGTKREMLFNVLISNKLTEHYEGVGAIAPDAWRNFQNTGRVASVGFDRGYKTNITNGEFVVELPIRRQFLEDNLYAQILNPALMLGDSFTLLTETDASSVLNNAFSASFVGGDGVALCSDSHPNGPEVSGTQDNNFTLTLSDANLETIRLAMQAFKDDKGNLLNVNPNAIIVPPQLEKTARQIIMSPDDSTTANRGINPRSGAYEIIRWDYLTDSNAFFMVDTVKMKQQLIWQDRVPLDIRMKNQDTTVFATWIARARYGFGWTDWTWIAGSNPS